MKKIIKKIPARKILSKTKIEVSNKKEITKETSFGEILNKHPELANDLFESGLHCLGCGMAMYETLEQGCLAHGMNKKQIENLIKKLNKKK